MLVLGAALLLSSGGARGQSRPDHPVPASPSSPAPLATPGSLAERLQAEERVLSEQLDRAWETFRREMEQPPGASWVGDRGSRRGGMEEVVTAMQLLAWNYLRQGRVLAAEDLFQESVRAAELLPPGDPLLERSLDGLVRFRRRRGEPRPILQSLRRLEAHLRSLDPVPRDRLAPLLAEIAGLLRGQGEREAACRSLEEAMGLYRRLHGARSAQAARLGKRLIRILLERGERERAAEEHRLLEDQERSGRLSFGRAAPPGDPELEELGRLIGKEK